MPTLRAAALLPLAVCTVVALRGAPSRADGDAPVPPPAAEVPAVPGAGAPGEAPSCLGKARLRGTLFEGNSATLVPTALPMLDVAAAAMKGLGASRPLTRDAALVELNRRVTFVVEGE